LYKKICACALQALLKKLANGNYYLCYACFSLGNILAAIVWILMALVFANFSKRFLDSSN
jgi:small-conductance mechanosensitive channel